MRKLNTRDFINAVRLVNHAGLKDRIQKETEDAIERKLSQRQIGINVIWTAITEIFEQNNEKELFAFLSGPFEMTDKEIESMAPYELCENLLEVAEPKEWLRFFERAGRSVSRNS